MVGYVFSDLVRFRVWFGCSGLGWWCLWFVVICLGLLLIVLGIDSHRGVSFGLLINLDICVRGVWVGLFVACVLVVCVLVFLVVLQWVLLFAFFCWFSGC